MGYPVFPNPRIQDEEQLSIQSLPLIFFVYYMIYIDGLVQDCIGVTAVLHQAINMQKRVCMTSHWHDVNVVASQIIHNLTVYSMVCSG